jgi:hypothetical protein
MEASNMNDTYEVLNPWAEADPVPLKNLADRVNDLEGKTIGLFRNSKRAALPSLKSVEKRLKEKYPAIKFTLFELMPNDGVLETDDRDRFEEWIKGVDGVVFAFGD